MGRKLQCYGGLLNDHFLLMFAKTACRRNCDMRLNNVLGILYHQLQDISIILLVSEGVVHNLGCEED